MNGAANVSGESPAGDRWKGRLFCLAAALLWSTAGLFVKRLTGPAGEGAGWSGWQVAGLRSAIAGVTLLAIARPRRILPTGPQCIVAVLLAGTMVPYVLALSLTSTANAILLQYAAPVYVLALSPWLLKERLRRADVVAIALIVPGMLLILPPGGGARTSLAGNLLGVFSGFTFAGVMLALRRWRDGSGITGCAWGNFLAAAIAIPMAMRGSGWVPLDTASALRVAFLGVFQLGVAYFLFQHGLRRLNAAEASLICLLEPVACPLWTFLFLGDRPSNSTIAGGMIILAAMALHTILTWPSRGAPELHLPDAEEEMPR